MPRLEGKVRPDICIIGAGVTGLSAALHLAEQGLNVVVLEAKRIGWGATGRSVGHIHNGAHINVQRLERKHGKETAKAILQSTWSAQLSVEALISRYQIDCDYRKGLLYVDKRRSAQKALQARVKALKETYGFHHVEHVKSNELSGHVGSNVFYSGVLDPEAARLHPLDFTLGLARAAREKGVKIFERSRVRERIKNTPAVLKTLTGNVIAPRVIFACNGYLDGLSWNQARYIRPIHRYVLVTEPLDEDLAKSLIPDGLGIAQMSQIPSQFHITPDNRLLFAAGETYGAEPRAKISPWLKRKMIKVFPQLQNVSIDYEWGGTVALTKTCTPQVREFRPNQFIAQGFAGTGLAQSVYYGQIIADAVCGKKDVFEQLSKIDGKSYLTGYPISRLTRNVTQFIRRS
ncbi:MAG: FAD-binding oxidoreductase [Sphingomonadales bacterium]